MVGSTVEPSWGPYPEGLLFWWTRKASALGGDPSGARRASMDERSESIDDARTRKHRRPTGRRPRSAGRSARGRRARASALSPVPNRSTWRRSQSSGTGMTPKPSRSRLGGLAACLAPSGRCRSRERSSLVMTGGAERLPNHGACVARLSRERSPFGSPPGNSVGRPSSATRLPTRLPRAASGRARERAQRAPLRPAGRPATSADNPRELPSRDPTRPETGVSCR